MKLDGEWGVVDVDDAVAAAEYLASIGEADGDRRATSGGSAGGYTTLAALAFRDTFGAGASFYGIVDIEMLMGDSHKLESRYETRLVGSDLAVWRERSPIHSVDEIDVPVALYQGLDDKVVPPYQAVVVAQALAGTAASPLCTSSTRVRVTGSGRRRPSSTVSRPSSPSTARSSTSPRPVTSRRLTWPGRSDRRAGRPREGPFRLQCFLV